jgi:hypothetical protein
MKVFVVYAENNQLKNMILPEGTNPYEWIAQQNSDELRVNHITRMNQIFTLINFWNVADFDIENIRLELNILFLNK